VTVRSNGIYARVKGAGVIKRRNLRDVLRALGTAPGNEYLRRVCLR